MSSIFIPGQGGSSVVKRLIVTVFHHYVVSICRIFLCAGSPEGNLSPLYQLDGADFIPTVVNNRAFSSNAFVICLSGSSSVKSQISAWVALKPLQ